MKPDDDDNDAKVDYFERCLQGAQRENEYLRERLNALLERELAARQERDAARHERDEARKVVTSIHAVSGRNADGLSRDGASLAGGRDPNTPARIAQADEAAELRLLHNILRDARAVLLASIRGTPDDLGCALGALNLSCRAHWNWQTKRLKEAAGQDKGKP